MQIINLNIKQTKELFIFLFNDYRLILNLLYLSYTDFGPVVASFYFYNIGMLHLHNPLNKNSFIMCQVKEDRENQ